MVNPGAPPPGFIYPVVLPADIEWAVRLFLTPLIAPTPVATRLPSDTSPNDTTYGFVRVEAGGGPKKNYLQYNQAILCHTYVPFEYEVQGEQIANTVIAYMSAATGVTIGGSCYVADVPHATAFQRRSDPRVNLLRLLSFFTWTIAGTPVSTG
jgi:hypothetical protein